MDLNKNWTREDNDKMREFIKENKSPEFIRNYFKNDKLFYHPNKKYYQSEKTSVIPTFKKKIENFEGTLLK